MSYEEQIERLDARDPYRRNLRVGEPGARHYDGLYVLPITFEDGKTRHIIGRMQEDYDGGMRAFTDPISGEVVGCCGVKFYYAEVKLLSDFIAAVK